MTPDDIKKLQEHQGYPSVTILIPTHKKMPERMQDPIRVKNLISQATDRLLQEFEKSDVLNIIRAIDELAQSIDYTKVLNGLAFFVNNNFAKLYNLPFDINEKVVIDTNFSTRDIVKALNKVTNYWVISLSQKPARLFKGTGNTLEEIIDPIELQQNMKGFPFQWNYDVTSDREILALDSGDLDSVYLSEQLTHFMHQVDNLLEKYVSANKWPIILLGVEKNRAYYTKITKYKGQIVGEAEGDFSRIPVQEIAKVTEPLINNYLKNQEENILKLFKESVSNKNTAFGIKKVWQEAQNGRVNILLIDENFSMPGSINSDNPDLIVLAENESIPGISDDLINDLIEIVIAKGGKVIFVKPNSLEEFEHVAAILRY